MTATVCGGATGPLEQPAARAAADKHTAIRQAFMNR
jgi:hypothetical protein